MGVPQIIMIILLSMAVTSSLVKHGEPKGTHNFWGSLIGAAIEVGILIWGGFF